MKRKTIMKIAVGLILALIISSPSYSAGIKAMHENQPVSGYHKTDGWFAELTYSRPQDACYRHCC